MTREQRIARNKRRTVFSIIGGAFLGAAGLYSYLFLMIFLFG